MFKGSINRLIYQKGVNMYGIWKTAWVGWISWDQLLYRYTIIFMNPMGKMVPGKQPLRESFNQLETPKTQVVPVAQVWRFYWCWCECVYWSEIFFLTVSIEFFESCLEGLFTVSPKHREIQNLEYCRSSELDCAFLGIYCNCRCSFTFERMVFKFSTP